MNTPSPLRPTESALGTATLGRKSAQATPPQGTPLFALLMQGVESAAAAPNGIDVTTTDTDTDNGGAEDLALADPAALFQTLAVPTTLQPATPVTTPNTAAATPAPPVSTLPGPTQSSTTIAMGPNTPSTLLAGSTEGNTPGNEDTNLTTPGPLQPTTITTSTPPTLPVNAAARWLTDAHHGHANNTTSPAVWAQPASTDTPPTTADLLTTDSTGARIDQDIRWSKALATDNPIGTAGEQPPSTNDVALGSLDTGTGTMGDGQGRSGEDMMIWSQAQLKKASLNLPDEGGGSLGIDVSLNQGEAALSFHSEDANLRAAIEQGGESALADMFKDNGLTLTGMSVGTRQPAEDQSTGAMLNKRRVQIETPNDDPTAGNNWVRPPHRDPGRALDVYA